VNLTNRETKERLIDTIALLAIHGIGRGRFRKLVQRFGSPGAVFSASKSDIETVPGMSHAIASAVRTGYDGDGAREIAARIVQLGWSALLTDDEEYPRSLREAPDPPVILFRMGNPPPLDKRMIAVVGTRHATENGRLFTHRLAGELAQAGIGIVSGMAEGIDSAAHRGALDSNGMTIAVWGTSLDIVFPASNRGLAREIRERGTIYSEYFPGTHADVMTFPERNRIISGLSDGVVVVEAGARSGALITAQCALDQGRELFAIPGPPGTEKSRGTNELIKKGAKLLTDVEDIFRELPRLKGEVTARRFKSRADMSDIEMKMVDFLSDGPLQIDQLSRMAELPVSDLMGFLLALELKGVVRELSGKRFVLAD